MHQTRHSSGRPIPLWTTRLLILLLPLLLRLGFRSLSTSSRMSLQRRTPVFLLLLPPTSASLTSSRMLLISPSRSTSSRMSHQHPTPLLCFLLPLLLPLLPPILSTPVLFSDASHLTVSFDIFSDEPSTSDPPPALPPPPPALPPPPPPPPSHNLSIPDLFSETSHLTISFNIDSD